ncbi:hypothetical protein GCM10028819_10300 [Spirosoma humi]
MDVEEYVRLTNAYWSDRFLFKTCFQNTAKNNALEGETVQTRAVVIGKKNYLGNSPVSQQFSYSYRFSVNGNSYEGDTRDPDLQIGDSLIIKYLPNNPEYSEPLD